MTDPHVITDWINRIVNLGLGMVLGHLMTHCTNRCCAPHYHTVTDVHLGDPDEVGAETYTQRCVTPDCPIRRSPPPK